MTRMTKAFTTYPRYRKRILDIIPMGSSRILTGGVFVHTLQERRVPRGQYIYHDVMIAQNMLHYSEREKNKPRIFRISKDYQFNSPAL